MLEFMLWKLKVLRSSLIDGLSLEKAIKVTTEIEHISALLEEYRGVK